ncbi:hemin transporter HemP [Rhodanobacter sp. C05]|nr:hemin transporter HemP [Rhodanobacter sp. C05]
MSTPVLSLTQPPVAPHRPASMSTAATATRQVSSMSLLAGARELVIQHRGSEYHLRLTRNDKLILTK